MIKKIDSDKYMDFWKEYSTNVKLGMIDDAANRTRLAKLLRYDFFEETKSTNLRHGQRKIQVKIWIYNGNFPLLYVLKMSLRRWVGGSKKPQNTLT